MKLISMTDFVLEIQSEIGTADYQVVAWQTKIHGYDRILKYAHFLKQPLTLGMFVPCDADGNFLEEPTIREVDYEEDLVDAVIDKRYEIAQSKVIFEGFKIIEILKDEYTHISDENVSLFFHNLAEIEVDTNSHNGYVVTPEDFINSNFNFDLVISF